MKQHFSLKIMETKIEKINLITKFFGIDSH